MQEIGAAQDTPDDVVFEHLNELCYPDQPMGRSLLGTAKTLKKFDRDMLRGYLSTHYRGPDMVVAAAGAVDHKRVVEEVDAEIRELRGTPAPKPQAGDVRQGRLARGASRPRTGASDAGARRRAADRSVAVLAAGVHQHARRRDVVAAVPGSAREARAVLFDLHLPRALYRHRIFRPLYRHRPRRRARDDGSDRRRHQRRRRKP